MLLGLGADAKVAGRGVRGEKSRKSYKVGGVEFIKGRMCCGWGTQGQCIDL